MTDAAETNSTTTSSTTEGAESSEASATEYREQRQRDWQAFTTHSGPPADHWEAYGTRTHDWKQRVAFLQPIGLDYPTVLGPLQPLLKQLEQMEEIELLPLEWINVITIPIGHLMSSDVMWSQVETFYVNSSPRIRRVAPFTAHFSGVSATEEALYIGLDDGYSFREVRRQVGLGVPKVAEVLRDDPLVTAEGDRYIPTVDFAYFTGKGDRQKVVEAVEPYLDAELGEFPVTHIKMGRIASEELIHFPPLDIVAEVGLIGKDYRRGYHN